MTLDPGEIFSIVRQLPDPSDSSTNYVRAVIRDAKTDATIDTVNLTDRGSRRFSGNWNVYSKRSDGFWIAVTTTVYTDAAYTTKSSNYAEEMQTYLVERRIQFGEGGAGVSYRRVKEVVTEALKEAEKPPVEPEEQIDPAPLIDAAVAQIKSHVSDVVAEAVPEAPDAVDLTPVLASIGVLGKAIEALGSTVPESVKAQLEAHTAELRDAMGKVASAIEDSTTGNLEAHTATQEAVGKVHKASVDKGASVEKLGKRIAEAVVQAVEPPVDEEEPVLSPYEMIRNMRKKK